MYFDLEDLRPETPSVQRVISVREAILMSLLFHALLVIAILLAPDSFFHPPNSALVRPVQNEEPVTFVHIVAPDKVAVPRRPAPASDMDRRAATPTPQPRAQDPLPKSQGNTDDRVVGAPEQQARGETPVPSPGESGAPTSMVPMTNPSPTLPSNVAAKPAGGLGDAFKNLGRYLQDQSFDNPKGGDDNQQADIQFDSKGVDFGPWLRRFVAQVKHNWFFPLAAQAMHGHVVITFNVHKDGRITDIQVLQPSPIMPFNTYAVQALKTSNPTLPLPAEYPVDPAFFTVTF